MLLLLIVLSNDVRLKTVAEEIMSSSVQHNGGVALLLHDLRQVALVVLLPLAPPVLAVGVLHTVLVAGDHHLHGGFRRGDVAGVVGNLPGQKT